MQLWLVSHLLDAAGSAATPAKGIPIPVAAAMNERRREWLAYGCQV